MNRKLTGALLVVGALFVLGYIIDTALEAKPVPASVLGTSSRATNATASKSSYPQVNVTFTSDPSDAEVSLDGRVVCRTPVTAPV